MKKRLISVFMAFSILILTIPIITANAASQGECGKNGSNLTWTLSSSGTLTISGAGEMKDFIGTSGDEWDINKVRKVVIEADVTSIGLQAFYNCKSLESIEIPNTVTSIGEYAFYNCDLLETIPLPTSIVNIGQGAFSDCGALKSIEIPYGVTVISAAAFEFCTEMTTISIPNSVTDIGEDAFVFCRNLSDVYYSGTSSQWTNINIESGNDCLRNANIHYGNSPKPTAKPLQPTAKPSPEQTDTSYTISDIYADKLNNSVTIAVNQNYPVSGTLIAASYSFDGSLMDMAYEDIYDSGKYQLNLNIKNAERVRAYIWDSLKGMRPISNTAEKITSINESYDFTEADISYDENGAGYINNIVIVYFEDGTTDREKEEVVESIGGTVAGQFDLLDQYQIRISKSDEYELDEICEQLEKDPCVLTASYDNCGDVKDEAYEWVNDPWSSFTGSDVEWKKDKSSTAYNVKDTYIADVWRFDNERANSKLSNVRVGVVEGLIRTNHADLNINVMNPEDNTVKNSINDLNHGTHVSGIIGATANNGLGIHGVAWKSTLIGYIYCNGSSEKSTTTSLLDECLVKAIEANCRIINFSNGVQELLGVENENDTLSTKEINKQGKRYSTAIWQLIQKNVHNFLIVKSAGNGVKVTNNVWGLAGIDAVNNGGFCSITEGNCCAGKYNEVMSHVIIVGASDNDHRRAAFSNFGSHVNIYAPGTNILSTAYNTDYTEESGTSMAAPHVSGLCAVLWSVNPQYSASQIKDWVINNYITGSDDTHIINAWNAFDAALKHTYHTISGQVYDKDEYFPLSNATITIHNKTSKKPDIIFTTDENGRFEARWAQLHDPDDEKYTLDNLLTGDDYDVYCKKDGYDSVVQQLNLNRSLSLADEKEHISLDIPMKRAYTGKVVDADDPSIALSNVAVTVYSWGSDLRSETAYTNADGIYTLKTTPSGEVRMTYECSGYNSTEKTYHLGNDSSSDLGVVKMKKKTGCIYGMVFDEETHNMLTGVSITVSGSKNTYYGETDIMGQFDIPCDNGVYMVTFEKSGYKSVTKNALVTVGAEYDMGNIYMQKDIPDYVGVYEHIDDASDKYSSGYKVEITDADDDQITFYMEAWSYKATKVCKSYPITVTLVNNRASFNWIDGWSEGVGTIEVGDGYVTIVDMQKTSGTINLLGGRDMPFTIYKTE